jgi:hypothetical protein
VGAGLSRHGAVHPPSRAGLRRAGKAQGLGRQLPAFVVKNITVWVLMVVVLVLVPDTLEPWLGLEIARVIGWAVAFPVWIVVVERDWQARFGPFTRVALQVPLWIAAALLAIWISEQAGRRVI